MVVTPFTSLIIKMSLYGDINKISLHELNSVRSGGHMTISKNDGEGYACVNFVKSKNIITI
jgi:hypothetical protein